MYKKEKKNMSKNACERIGNEVSDAIIKQLMHEARKPHLPPSLSSQLHDGRL
jgi:hypothetical protein